MSRPVIVIGGGGHAGVVIDTLRLGDHEILGIADPELDPKGDGAYGLPILGDDDAVLARDPDGLWLANGIGSTRSTEARARAFRTFDRAGFRFVSLFHPTACVAENVLFTEGIQVMAGAVIQPGAVFMDNVIVNTRASVDHDCQIGSHVHIAPGVTLSGGVSLGEGVHVGSGAVVIQSVTIGAHSLIGAGAVVTRDVPPGGVLRAPEADLEVVT